jgi:hypothetical protein
MAEQPQNRSSSVLADDAAAVSVRAESSADSTIASVSPAKLCCMCGVDLHGKKRYKDSDGRYWCAECNDADIKRRQPATCPDCNKNMTFGDLIEFKGTPVCQACWEKRRQSAKREEARLRAAEEVVELERQRRRKWFLAAATLVGVLAVYGVVMLIIWLGQPAPIVPGR